MGLVKDIQEGIKAFGEIAVKPLLAIALCSGFMLFASDSVLKLLSMTSLVDQYRAWLGGAFTLSCAYLLAHGLNSCAVIFFKVLNTRTLAKQRMKWLATLTPDEKSRLVPYIEKRFRFFGQ